jgi:hypothetical protein
VIPGVWIAWLAVLAVATLFMLSIITNVESIKPVTRGVYPAPIAGCVWPAAWRGWLASRACQDGQKNSGQDTRGRRAGVAGVVVCVLVCVSRGPS